MATMVKEKRRAKKKAKEKPTLEVLPDIGPECLENSLETAFETSTAVGDNIATNLNRIENIPNESVSKIDVVDTDVLSNVAEDVKATESSSDNIPYVSVSSTTILDSTPVQTLEPNSVETVEYSPYSLCNESLEQYMSDADISLGSEAKESNQNEVITENQISIENVVPSAPVFEEPVPTIEYRQEILVANEVVILKSMPLEEAIGLFGGAEIAEIMELSKREEAFIENGPLSGPEHPLVDLLSTFRQSLIAVERESAQLTISYSEEAKYRSTLWKIEKMFINKNIECPCGRNVTFKAKYDHAELQKNKMPVARMKLESLLKNVQESYCHHQHVALFAHYQIEEFISETIKGNIEEIREALTLVLQVLKLSDNAPSALAQALQRWARALAAALLRTRDWRHLLFLIHHLFRQSRSVSWAAGVLNVLVNDGVSAAKTIALLNLLLTKTSVDHAVECLEDKDEAWEEVAADGGGGAVSDSTLRERDLLALVRALPLRAVLARILQLSVADIRDLRDYDWEDSTGGRGVLRACCGLRALLQVCARAPRQYSRLRLQLRALLVPALQALHAKHDRARFSYSPNMISKVLGELQAVFVAALQFLDPNELHHLPIAILVDHAAREYCDVQMQAIAQHGDELSQWRVESLATDLPAASCGVRVRSVAQAAVQRRTDYDLARHVIEFLFQIGVKRNTSVLKCDGKCRQIAREAMTDVLTAHPFLYPIVLHLVAETSQVEKLEPSSIECLALDKWRPQCGEIVAVLDDWAQRSPQLLQQLLTMLDYTPHTGVSLESQLAIGSWLCSHVRLRPGQPEEWYWLVLRKLRLSWPLWCLPRTSQLEPPPPDPEPDCLFAKAHALLATSWGHSIPMICNQGVEALCSLAESRVTDALHCLSTVMLQLSESPASVAHTARFTDLFVLVLNSGPSLMQRALRRGGATGADMLLLLIQAQLENEYCGSVHRSTLIEAWVAALWHNSSAAAALLDTALLPPQRWSPLQQRARTLLVEDSQALEAATHWGASAPLVCWCALLAKVEADRHAPRLARVLHDQRARGMRTHVDNALMWLGINMKSDDLAIYQAATAVMSAPLEHPAHILLWRLLLYLYLQRPPDERPETTAPVGPLFFSGLIKSRTLSYVKRSLQDAIKYHGDEAAVYKNQQDIAKASTSSANRSKSKSNISDDKLTLPLTIKDFTDEGTDSSDEDLDSYEDTETKEASSDIAEAVADAGNLLAYHEGARRMLCEFNTWLEQGETVRAFPHLADNARFIPERALEAAFILAYRKKTPTQTVPNPPLPPRAPPAPVPAPTPLQLAKEALLSVRQGNTSKMRQPTLKSPVEEFDVKNPRALIALVDKNLRDIELLAEEWQQEVAIVASLDSALWQLVAALRAPRPLPSLRNCCANKCKPIVFNPEGEEWCISTGAQQAVVENRESARLSMRKLARARPQTARSAAALLGLARRISSVESGRAVWERGWLAAGAASARCPPAAELLHALLTVTAQRWLVRDGELCAELISKNCSSNISSLQESCVGTLVAPQRILPQHLPALHTALLEANLPPAALFSSLSKFEMGSWSKQVDSKTRYRMLESLTAAVKRWGPTPSNDYQLLVELLGVQTAATCAPSELCHLVLWCARDCVRYLLPATHLRHITSAARCCADHVGFDQLGHLLREVGLIWWEARAGEAGSRHCRLLQYAAPTAELLLTLHAAFVGAAVALSYVTEKVSALAWSTLQESWSPWVVPQHSGPSLLRLEDQQYAAMLQYFVTGVRRVADQCEGSEEYMLGHVWEWAIETCLVVKANGSQQGRVESSALLSELATLPWDQHQGLKVPVVGPLLQVSQSGDAKLQAWCADRCSHWPAAAWLAAPALGPHLATLLYLFTAASIPFSKESLDTACQFPWQHLPESELDEVLQRFFVHHYSVKTAYHDLPQFRVVLSACEMVAGCSLGAWGPHKRARFVSVWTRAAAAPPLLAHVGPQQDQLLRLLFGLAPEMENPVLEDLLSRALMILCIEPGAAAALPMWECHLESASLPVARASLQAIAHLTVFEYFAPLAEVAIRKVLQLGGEWQSILSKWRSSVWSEVAPLCARARLHAAYATHAAATPSTPSTLESATPPANQPGDEALRTALLALIAADIDFAQNDVIVAVWICAACRIAKSCSASAGSEDCGTAARALLARWNCPRKLLGLLTLPPETTTGHRQLCLLAQCILSPGDEAAARAFEAGCSILGASSWGRSPTLKKLPQFAATLYPLAENYFSHELLLAEDESG